MKRDLKFEQEYPHPIERVWRAISDAPALAEWLMPNDFEARMGHKFQFEGPATPESDGIVRCEVIELDPPRRLAYTWAGGNQATVVRFTLAPTATGTRLTLEHSGFTGVGGAMIDSSLRWTKMVANSLPRVLQGLAGGGGHTPPAEGGKSNAIETLLGRYAEGIHAFRETMAGIPERELDRAPEAEGWSARQIAMHVVDAEIVGAARLRQLAAEPGSVLRSYAGDVWGRELRYERQRLEPALELFRALRVATLEMLRGLPKEKWDNPGTHEETGEVTLGSYFEAHCAHFDAHLEEIAGLRAAGQRERRKTG